MYHFLVFIDHEQITPLSKQIHRAATIELGHTFLLGLKYSAPFDSTYRDARNKDVLLEMGCYGIGVSRLIAACAEGVDQMSYRESDFCCSVTICQS